MASPDPTSIRRGIPRPLAVDEQLFDHADKQLDTSLALACANQGGAADLVEDCGRALFTG